MVLSGWNSLVQPGRGSMRLVKGTSRFVILVPEIGLVFKFPIMHFARVRELLKVDLPLYGWDYVLPVIKGPIESDCPTVRGWLFKGFVANWMESSGYRRTHDP